MKLSDVGEFKLLHEHVLAVLGKNSGLGDDCGWMELGDGKVLLVSTDAMSEDTHYQRRWMKGSDLARKAFRTAVSDIAAMGGATDLGCVVTYGELAQSDLARHQDFMEGLKKEAKRWDTRILGGDLVEAKGKEFVSTTVFGISESKRLLKRSQACAGETVWLTGPVGSSKAGLEVMLKGMEREYPDLTEAHKLPPLRLKEAGLLSFRNLSRCAMDLSDSLATSLLWLAKMSRQVDFEINLRQLPVSRILERWSRRSRKNLEEYLLYGGEDYEILFTSWCSHRVILRYLPHALPIGRVVSGSGRIRVSGLEGNEFELDEGRIGYQAFS